MCGPLFLKCFNKYGNYCLLVHQLHDSVHSCIFSSLISDLHGLGIWRGLTHLIKTKQIFYPLFFYGLYVAFGKTFFSPCRDAMPPLMQNYRLRLPTHTPPPQPFLRPIMKFLKSWREMKEGKGKELYNNSNSKSLINSCFL